MCAVLDYSKITVSLQGLVMVYWVLKGDVQWNIGVQKLVLGSFRMWNLVLK